MATVTGSQRQLTHTSSTYTSSGNITVGGNLEVQGTTTTIDTANLLVEDKNIVIGNVTTPSDTTADGGGITLKGATDKTLNWVDSTDSWTSSETFSAPNLSLTSLSSGASVTTALMLSGTTVVTRGLGSAAFSNTSAFAAAGDENIIDGATSIWNADGDGDVFIYNDANPTHNTKYVGAMIDITGDGTYQSSLVRAGIFTSDHVSTENGYYVGTLLGSGNSTTTQVINSSGVWTGAVIPSAKLDADTAHLSGTQTFSGAKTFSTNPKIASTGNISFAMDKTNVTTTTDLVSYVSFQASGSEKGWVGFGSNGDSNLTVRNTSGKVVLNGSSGSELGTVVSGTWQATDIGVAYGGTGASNAADARSNLGITPANIGAATSSHTHDDRYFTETESDARFLGITAKAADSDKLDNLDSSSFLRSNVDDTYTGTLTLNGHVIDSGDAKSIRLMHGTTNSQPSIGIGEQGTYGMKMRWDSGANVEFDGFWNTSVTGSRNRDLGSINVNTSVWSFPSGVLINGSTAWHAGNDGSGSTLDADTVDGIQASSFLRSDANDTTTGSLTISGSSSYGTYSSASQYHTGADNLILKGNSSGISTIFFESEKDGTNINHPTDFGFIQYHPYGTGTTGESNELIIGVSNDSDDNVVLNAPNAYGLKFRIGTSETDYNIWHSGNDGTGSGLDADKLDGQHASAFAASSHTHDDRYYTETEATNHFKTLAFQGNYMNNYEWSTDLSGSTDSGWGGLGTAPYYPSGSFSNNGTAAENIRSISVLPNGAKGVVWRTPLSDTASNDDGGWNCQINGVQDSKLYRSVVYFRRTADIDEGTFYHGCDSSNTLNVDASSQTNPYFQYASINDLFVVNRWYVSVGYIQPYQSGGTTHSNRSGIYDCVTGKKIVAGNDFMMKSGSTQQVHRTYIYYTTNTATEGEFWGPRFEEVNGNEPSIRELIAKGADGELGMTIHSKFDPATLDQLTESSDAADDKFLLWDQSAGNWKYIRMDDLQDSIDTNTTYTLGSFGITATSTELNYTDGVTSNIQTQLNARTADNTNGTISGSRNFTGTFSLGGTTITATGAELNYVDGVTSNIQTQLNAKAALASPTFTGTPTAPTASVSTSTTQIATTEFVRNEIDDMNISYTDLDDLPNLNLKANLASPALTGTPTAPTAAANTNTTQIATTEYVQTEIADLIGGAPGALDTLNEIAAAINDDSSYASTITTALSAKAPLASPAFSGNPTAPTPATSDNDTSIATTAFVKAQSYLTTSSAASTYLGISAKAADSNLLDGIDSSAFLRSNATDTATGALTLSNTGNHYSGHHYFDAFDAAGNHYPHYMNGSSGAAAVSTRIYNAGGGSYDLLYFAAGDNNPTWRGNKIWNAGNDGSGSGLDADTLDGQHASAFLTGNQTITLSGDASGSGTTSISVSVAGLIKRADIGGSANLNSYTTDGYYHQNSNANASSGSNYPTANAGMLTVQSDGLMIYQKYQAYGGNNRIYHRQYYNGTWESWQTMFSDAYHPNADTLTTARNIALTGAVTGNANFDGSGNISITTTATADPTLTLSGDASGSATFTNLGNATLSVSIADDSHNHHRLDSTDDRDVKPSTSGIVSGTQAIKPFFTTFNGMTGSSGGAYLDMLAFDTYSDSSGGGPNAITFHKSSSAGDPKMYIWKADWNATTWSTGQRVFADNYHPNADKLTTARNIALTGAVTGNANFDGSGNISIATTATADPTLTINGDASGSATFTNLGNATLTLTIADDSHAHTIANVDGLQTALDAKQAAGTYNTIIGTDTDIDTSGSTIIDNIYVTDGVITSMGTRTLTPGDIGAATSAQGTTADNALPKAGGTMTGNINLNSSAIYNGSYLSTNTSGTRSKIRLWGTSSDYTIGMNATYTFGGLGSYAMSFQMNNDSSRGFWWGDSAHGNAAGAMALTTNGKLTVASNIRVGFGESDTTTPNTYYSEFARPIKLDEWVYSSRPSAYPRGQKAFLIDSPYPLSTCIGNVISGGGSYFIPVYSDGTYWRAG